MSRVVSFGLLGLIGVGYLILGVLYATQTPAWQVPDEPAHYNYIAQLSTFELPVIQSGDWDNAYLESLKAARFSQQSQAGRLFTIQYEDHQPPLYYILATPIFLLTSGALIPLRLLSVVIGLGVVICGFATVYTLFPKQPYLALIVAALIAFLPQHLAMMSGVNNDCLAELMVGLTLWSCARWIVADQPNRIGYALRIGLLIGIGSLTKVTTYSVAAVAVITFLLILRRQDAPNIKGGRRKAAFLVSLVLPGAMLGGLWFARNMSVYGVPDILGLRAHDAVVVGQLRTTDLIAQVGFNKYLIDGLQTTFQSFWGQFGWMGVILPRNIVSLLVFFNVFVLMGAGIAFVQFRGLLAHQQRDGLLVLLSMAGLAMIQYVYYNLSFVQFQGRYLYVALISFGMYFAAGLTGWGSLYTGRGAIVVRWGIAASFGMGMAGLAGYLLFRVLVPGLSG
jgi:4-amino-4-deoxy-L-arabinose transferase-like glycosyltransferase